MIPYIYIWIYKYLGGLIRTCFKCSHQKHRSDVLVLTATVMVFQISAIMQPLASCTANTQKQHSQPMERVGFNRFNYM